MRADVPSLIDHVTMSRNPSQSQLLGFADTISPGRRGAGCLVGALTSTGFLGAGPGVPSQQ